MYRGSRRSPPSRGRRRWRGIAVGGGRCGRLGRRHEAVLFFRSSSLLPSRALIAGLIRLSLISVFPSLHGFTRTPMGFYLTLGCENGLVYSFTVAQLTHKCTMLLVVSWKSALRLTKEKHSKPSRSCQQRRGGGARGRRERRIGQWST